MGIKGIFGEIGEGERVALSKLAVETLEKEGRPLRIAIDISIWHFQTQAGKGGSNPALRTLYYRLLRLLSLSIQPIFVFDGPNKPKFKRNKKVGSGAALPNFLAKQVIQFFGFPCHNAPGEAEAECALLQREGVVDAVLSEDVDTLMFGCGLTFRNWSSQSHNGAPTHVSVYKAEETKKGSGLDRSGMVLVAMMSGGDYIPEGIPRCGVKIACQAARAGFGNELCQISRNDEAGLQSWKQRLIHEMQTNESKFFRSKHKALKIPEEFPDREVLGYYTNPVVSKLENIIKLKRGIKWSGGVDSVGLRAFVAEAFEWTGKSGAMKYIRGLAPALLVSKLVSHGNHQASGLEDVALTALNEMDLVRSITGQRAHLSTDGVPELRLNFVPNDIVEIDLDAESDESNENEEFGRNGLAINPEDDEEIALYDEYDQQDNNLSPRKRGPSKFDATVLDKIWVPQTFVKYGIPLKVEDYEETLRHPKKLAKKVTKPKTAVKKSISSDMPSGALDKYVKTTKSGQNAASVINKLSGDKQPELLPAFLAPLLEGSSREEPISLKRPSRAKSDGRIPAPTSRTTRSRPAKKLDIPRQVNPWAKVTSNPNSSLSVSRHSNNNATTTTSSLNLKLLPDIDSNPPPWEDSSSLSQGGHNVGDVESAGYILNTMKTPRKTRDALSPVGSMTPACKTTIRSIFAASHKKRATPINGNGDVPSSSTKVNRLINFSPTISGRAVPISSQLNLSFDHRDLDDVFSSPTKERSSSTKLHTSNIEAENNFLVSALDLGITERETIILDDSPPPSPTPASNRKTQNNSTIRNRNKELRDRQVEFHVQKRLSPSKRNFDFSPPLQHSLRLNNGDRRGTSRKRYLIVRDSFQGSWEEVEELETVGRDGGVWELEAIEVVDLSGD